MKPLLRFFIRNKHDTTEKKVVTVTPQREEVALQRIEQADKNLGLWLTFEQLTANSRLGNGETILTQALKNVHGKILRRSATYNDYLARYPHYKETFSELVQRMQETKSRLFFWPHTVSAF